MTHPRKGTKIYTNGKLFTIVETLIPQFDRLYYLVLK
jgi:hypothetical protein